MLPVSLAAAALCVAVVICIWASVAALFHLKQHPACPPPAAFITQPLMSCLLIELNCASNMCLLSQKVASPNPISPFVFEGE